jgi:hypothetical protein
MEEKNVDMKVEKGVLVIRVDLSKDFGPSASGKTTIVGTTGGGVDTGGGVKVNLTVYRKKA